MRIFSWNTFNCPSRIIGVINSQDTFVFTVKTIKTAKCASCFQYDFIELMFQTTGVKQRASWFNAGPNKWLQAVRQNTEQTTGKNSKKMLNNGDFFFWVIVTIVTTTVVRRHYATISIVTWNFSSEKVPSFALCGRGRWEAPVLTDCGAKTTPRALVWQEKRSKNTFLKMVGFRGVGGADVRF